MCGTLPPTLKRWQVLWNLRVMWGARAHFRCQHSDFLVALGAFGVKIATFWWPRWPKGPQGRPKVSQECPRGSQREPPGIPGASQGVPREPQWLQKATQMTPPAPPGRPKWRHVVPDGAISENRAFSKGAFSENRHRY